MIDPAVAAALLAIAAILVATAGGGTPHRRLLAIRRPRAEHDGTGRLLRRSEHHSGSAGPPGTVGAADLAARERLGRRTRARWSAGVAGLGAALVVGGAVGVVLGLALAFGLPRGLSRLESGADRHRRERLVAQAPEVVDLLAACLASGAPVDAAAQAVADAVGEPVAEPLRGLVASLRLGADPAVAWRTLTQTPGLRPMAVAVARSVDSGAPLATVLPRVADDLRRRARAEVQVAAEQAGVRAVAPLAACFLPAFLLLGVVPVIASLVTGLV